jgi:2-(1,2-epoxy-1,2-dihydrophenyl)acetyl-CoA isomerase
MARGLWEIKGQFMTVKVLKLDKSIFLNKPETRNALDLELVQSFTNAIIEAEKDEACKLIIITGEGKSFSSGGNIKDMKNKTDMFSGDSFKLRHNYEWGIQQIPRIMERIEKPILAAVNGAAIGAGCDLACMSDLRYGSEHAKFGETFAKIGLVPGDGGPYFLSRVVGFSKAMEMALTCEIVDAQKALKIGLLNDVFEGPDLIENVVLKAYEILKQSPEAIRLTKKAYKSLLPNLEHHLQLLAAYQGIAQRLGSHFERL